MPRFYFNIYEDVALEDEDGIELPDLEAARRAALAGIRGLLCDQLREGRLILHHRVEIADAGGALLLSIRFEEAVLVKN